MHTELGLRTGQARYLLELSAHNVWASGLLEAEFHDPCGENQSAGRISEPLNGAGLDRFRIVALPPPGMAVSRETIDDSEICIVHKADDERGFRDPYAPDLSLILRSTRPHSLGEGLGYYCRFYLDIDQEPVDMSNPPGPQRNEACDSVPPSLMVVRMARNACMATVSALATLA